jgi:hypothetical protein
MRTNDHHLTNKHFPPAFGAASSVFANWNDLQQKTTFGAIRPR